MPIHFQALIFDMTTVYALNFIFILLLALLIHSGRCFLTYNMHRIEMFLIANFQTIRPGETPLAKVNHGKF